MKRSFLLLLFAFIALYTKVTYDLWREEAHPENGLLSDVAEQVTVIPLQPDARYPIGKPRNIRKDGDNLFLVGSDNALYRFNISGRLLNRVTKPEVIRVAEYIIDPLRKQLIVLGNADDIHYYMYDGKPTDKKKPEPGNSCRHIRAAAMHQGYIWTVEERICRHDNPVAEHHLVKYDASFHEMESHRLTAAALPGKPFIPFFGNMTIAVKEDTGIMYVCSAPLQPGYLLRDSLLLSHRPAMSEIFSSKNDTPVLPLHMGKRFWFASSNDPTQNYVFCFDQVKQRSWQMQNGFKDDYYHTGFITEWQPLDMYGHTYCFSKPGESTGKLSRSGAPVVFIVKLKA
ncbi:MAG: 6-bladed beta-propeller [Tannerellaceae bacterium]|jgi:hypothetical protein|nr:6-bladed beta-propeller [Tannerellaceae bacterium]